MVIALEMNYDPGKVWNSIREILKRNGWSKYYDHIPFILQKLRYGYMIKYKYNVTEKIVLDFKKIIHGFGESRFADRKYLLNFRYIALKLMLRHGVVFEYFIPLLQTKRLIKDFDEMWLELEKYIK